MEPMPWYRWCQPGVCCHTDNNIMNPRSSVSMSRHSRHCHSVSWFDRFITWLGSFVSTTGGWGSCDTWQPIMAGFVIWGLQVQIPGWRFECLCVWTASLKDCTVCTVCTVYTGPGNHSNQKLLSETTSSSGLWWNEEWRWPACSWSGPFHFHLLYRRWCLCDTSAALIMHQLTPPVFGVKLPPALLFLQERRLL